ncbi:hypothetical protein B566_EDAN018433 [Ephemera danica]|nr:hypothetical protein B566_EDAN018433 [Ephemera danica]
MESHRRAIAAQQAGEFAGEITPVKVITRTPNLETGEVSLTERLVSLDEGARADTTLEALGKLRPAFAAPKDPTGKATGMGSVTAGNSSQTSDGAGALILASEAAVKRFGLTPLARFVSFASRGVAPEIMGIGPIEAIPAALRYAGLNQDQIDWIKLDAAKVNPMGGAIALGHPLGATGAIRAATVVHALRRKNLKYFRKGLNMSIKAGIHNGVALIEIARPEKKNALTSAMYQAMADALRAAQTASSVRAVLITGQPGIFTSGNDIDDFMQRPPGQGGSNALESPVFQFMHALLECEKPVVAAVTGAAIGIGTTLLLHCDFVYVADDARLAMPFVGLGLVPEFASSLLVPQLMGQRRAAEKLLLGDPFTPEAAVECGIANAVLPAPEVLNHARRVAERFNALPPGAVRGAKKLMNGPQREAVLATIRTEGAFRLADAVGADHRVGADAGDAGDDGHRAFAPLRHGRQHHLDEPVVAQDVVVQDLAELLVADAC